MGTDATPDPATGFENILQSTPRNSITTDVKVNEAGGVAKNRMVVVTGSVLGLGGAQVEYPTSENEDGVYGVTLEAGALNDIIRVIVSGKAILEVPLDELARNGDPVISMSANGYGTTGKKVKDGTRVNSIGTFINAQGDVSSSTAVPMEILIDRREAYNRVMAADEETKSGTDTGNLVVEGTSNIAADTQNMTFTLPDGAYDGQRKFIVLTNATFYADITVTNSTDGASAVYRLLNVGDMLHLAWNCNRWEVMDTSTGRRQIVTDASATAFKGGPTLFKNTTGSPFTITIPDGDYEGQRKLVIGDQGGAGALNVEVTNHFLGTPYTIQLRGNGSSVEFVWSEDQGLWTTLVPSGATAIPTGNTCRFMMTVSGGPKIQPLFPTLLEGTPNESLVMGGNIDILMAGGDVNMGGGRLEMDGGDIRDTLGGNVTVSDSLDVTGVLNVNGADGAFTVSGVSVTPSIIAQITGATEIALAGEVFIGDANTAASVALKKARGTEGTPAIVQAGDNVSSVSGFAFDGTDYHTLAQMLFQVQAGSTPASNDVEGSIFFLTSSGALPQTAMQLHSDQRVEVYGVLETRASIVRKVTEFTVTGTLNPQTHHVAVITAAGVTLSLPATPEDGMEFIIKRSYSGANSTLSGNGNNIDGAATKNINTNYLSYTVIYSSAVGEWMLV